MPSTDLKTRFLSEYKGDLKDPVLTLLLETIGAYQEEVEKELLLTAYARRNDTVADGFFEILRRHLFGQMVPGPAFVIAQASLRDANAAAPLYMEQHHYLSLQDQAGDKVLFAPQHLRWIVPSRTNDVRIEVVGDDLLLGLAIPPLSIPDNEEGSASLYMGSVDPLLLERMRCRLALPGKDFKTPAPPSTLLRRGPGGTFNPVDECFQSTYATRFLEIPFSLLRVAGERSREGVIWVPFPGLGARAKQLERQMMLNAFVAWNMVEGESLAQPLDQFRLRVPRPVGARYEAIITGVRDLGVDPSVEYLDVAAVTDPAYPFQYSAAADSQGIILALSPPAQGDVRVSYCQYDLTDAAANIAAGRSFGLHQGLDEKIKSVQSVTPTHRLDVLNDRERVWHYFRSLLTSRHRWLTRDDLRAAVTMFPPLAAGGVPGLVSRIDFEEKVGRVDGFLAPYTEISVVVRDGEIATSPDQQHFERTLTSYLKARSVSGNFIRVRLVEEGAA